MSTKFFTIKTKDDKSVNEVLNKQNAIEFRGLNVLSDELEIGHIVFIVFGGDKPKWETGLVGIGIISKLPYDFEDRNFKIQADIKILLSKPLKRADFVLYPETFDIIGIGPITKWEPNQALSKVDVEKAFSLLNAIYNIDDNIKKEFEIFFDNTQLVEIKRIHRRYKEINQLSQLQNLDNSPSSTYTQNFSQIIYYGVPGSGKSHTIDAEIKNIPDEQKIRVVFHPDYTNADFVGQILPSNAGGTVKYEFKPGPFTKILWRAYNNPEKPYYIVIEEINRGNAAAIFGDIFQLLDRIKSTDELGEHDKKYGIGWSKYFVENEFINNYLRNKTEYGQNEYNEQNSQPQVTFAGNIDFTSNTGIRLPPNLSLLATMNTSDQNVFTLDNAFQRRWDMELVPNKLDVTSAQYGAKIADTNISWGIFREFINEQISKKSVGTGLSSMEDKRLGGWFVKADGNITAEIFANKVLKYLYDDAFKFSRQEIFAEYEKFEKLHFDFIGKNGNERFSIFTDEIKNALFDEASKGTQQDVISDKTGQDAPNGDNANA